VSQESWVNAMLKHLRQTHGEPYYSSKCMKHNVKRRMWLRWATVASVVASSAIRFKTGDSEGSNRVFLDSMMRVRGLDSQNFLII
jgi:hypothetical protein